MRKTVGKLLAVTFVMLGAIVLASPVEVLAKKCSVVKRVDTFLNTIFRKDRITPGFPCRTPLFHLVYNHQAKSEGV